MSSPEEGGATLNIVHFREQVRHALEHLYDADVLADHWLTHQLRLAHEPTGSRAMRQTLIDGIQGMRPSQGEPPGSQRWQMHQVLLQRYVQQIGANALADQQGMSSRTLRTIATTRPGSAGRNSVTANSAPRGNGLCPGGRAIECT